MREVKALGHDIVHHDTKSATCVEIGWEAYVTCSRCDYTTYVEKPATGHVIHQLQSYPHVLKRVRWNEYVTLADTS